MALFTGELFEDVIDFMSLYFPSMYLYLQSNLGQAESLQFYSGNTLSQPQEKTLLSENDAESVTSERNPSLTIQRPFPRRSISESSMRTFSASSSVAEYNFADFDTAFNRSPSKKSPRRAKSFSMSKNVAKDALSPEG